MSQLQIQAGCIGRVLERVGPFCLGLFAVALLWLIWAFGDDLAEDLVEVLKATAETPTSDASLLWVGCMEEELAGCALSSAEEDAEYNAAFGPALKAAALNAHKDFPRPQRMRFSIAFGV